MSSGPPDSHAKVDAIVDAMDLATREARVTERFRIASLARLADMSVEADSGAELQIRFHWLDGRCGVAGQVNAVLRTTCQRCLQPVDLEIEDRFHIVLVKSEDEMSELPDEQDSLIADPGHLDLAWLTEEQLLLAMPLVPLHAIGACGAKVERRAGAALQDEAAKQKPFAQLGELLRKQPTK